MKKITKKLLALCCVAALMLGLSVSSLAASTYTVHGSTSQLQILQDGKVVVTYLVKTNNLTLNSKNGSLILNFKDSSNKTRNISLGSQSALNISGSLSTLTVHAPVKITVSDSAKLSKVTSSNKNASIKTASGKTVSSSTVKAPSTTVPVKKSTSNSNSSANQGNSSGSAVKLTVKPINASDGDNLDYLLDQLNENVTARDASSDYVAGECKWNTNLDREVTDDINMGFTFYPEMDDYAPVKGTVKIYVDGNSEDITISYKDFTQSSPLVAEEGDRLSSFTKTVKDNIYVENDNGDSVSYTFKWDSSASTKFTGDEAVRGYNFSITPSGNRYAKAEGTIYIVGASKAP